MRGLLDRLDKVFPLEGSRGRDELAGRIGFLKRVFGSKVVYETETSFRTPLVAVVTGGTNVGKSEVFNALAGERISRPDPRAGMTRRPGVFADPAHAAEVGDPRFLPGYDRTPLDDPDLLNQPCGERLVFHHALRPGERGLILVDSPDIDSSRTENLSRAEHLLAAADAVVFVTSPSKYNDEACVTFLRRALDLGRAVAIVFNLLGDGREKILMDFRASVLDAPIVEVPRFAPGEDVHEKMSAALAGLRGRLRGMIGKEEQARAALAYVQREIGAVTEAIGRDLAALEGLRARSAEALAQARRGYDAELAKEKAHEIESIFAEVLDHFRVPIIDDILNAPVRALKWVVRKVRGTDPEPTAIEKRRGRDRKRVAETIDGLRAGALKSLAEGASDPLVAAVLRRATEGPLGAGAEAAVERAWDEGEPRFVAWRDTMRAEMIEKIRQSPNLKVFLQTSKAVVQIGTGVLTGLLLGAPVAVDIVTGSLAAKFTQYMIETFGNAYFEDKRRAYVELHLDRFDALGRRFVLDPLEAAFPARPDRAELDAIRGEIGGLRL